jgi:hypothetical protein
MVEVIWEDHGVVRQFSGKVGDREFIQSSIEIQADPRFDNLGYVIQDFSRCTELAVDDDTIEEGVARASIALLSKLHFRVAFVGTLPGLRDLTAKMANSSFCPPHLRTFETMEDARIFVGS